MVYMPHWPKRARFDRPIVLGTERIETVLSYLGNPEKNLPPTIHITGTNGKGSTLSFVRSILEKAQYRVHTYTSPHLFQFNERIVLRGTPISDDYLFDTLERCRVAAESTKTMLTLFEASTIAGFLAFSETPADFLLLEVGMGGRLDATNVIGTTIASIITNISYDHEDFLGHTLESIAFEKAGILREGIPCIIGKQVPSIAAFLEQFALAISAMPFSHGTHWHVEEEDHKRQFISHHATLELPRPSLLGDHQIDNAGNAVACLTTLRHLLSLPLTDQNIARGIQDTTWPARLERITTPRIIKRLPPQWEIFLDGAHNDSGAQSLAKWAEQQANTPLYVILGMTRGKNTKSFLKILKPHASFICGVCVQGETNAQLGTEIAKHAQSLNIPCLAFDFLVDALDYILKHERRASIKILICGSLYLAKDVKNLAL